MADISLLVVPRPLLPEEAASTQAPLMLVGPDKCSIYVRTSSTATTGQRFRFGTHGALLLPPNERAYSWLAPELPELAKSVHAGRTIALMVIGGAHSGKASVLLGVGDEPGGGALHAAVAALRQTGPSPPRLRLSWQALVAETAVDLLDSRAGGAAHDGDPMAAVSPSVAQTLD